MFVKNSFVELCLGEKKSFGDACNVGDETKNKIIRLFLIFYSPVNFIPELLDDLNVLQLCIKLASLQR